MSGPALVLSMVDTPSGSGRPVLSSCCLPGPEVPAEA